MFTLAIVKETFFRLNTEVNEQQKRKTIQYPYPAAAKGRGLRGICLERHHGGGKTESENIRFC